MIGRKIIFEESIPSTSNYVAKLLSKGEIDHGTVILAGAQTQGRGQMGAIWESEPYLNLTFSFFVEHATLSVNNQFQLLKAISLSVCDLLRQLELSASIKWPNDILVGTAKICGILIENQLEQQQIKSSIVGIGLNVNQTEFGDFNASSIQLLTNKRHDVREMLLNLLPFLNQRFAQLLSGNYSRLDADYNKLLWLNQTSSVFSDSRGEFRGVIQGTDAIGRLIVRDTDRDETRLYQHKEIVFLERFVD